MPLRVSAASPAHSANWSDSLFRHDVKPNFYATNDHLNRTNIHTHRLPQLRNIQTLLVSSASG